MGVTTIFLFPQDKAVVGGTGAPVIIVAWSLQYEILFYLAFAAAIFNLRFGIAIMAVFIIALIWTRLSGQGHAFPGFLSLTYFALFAMGVAASMWASSSIMSSTASVIWHCCLVFLCVAWVADATYALATQGETHMFSTTVGRLVLGFWALLLIASRAALDMRYPTEENLTTKYLADCSYLIYLVHFPVISAAAKISVALGLDGLGGACLTAAIAVPGTLILSAILHETIEKPAIAFARHITSIKPRGTVA